MEVFEPLETPDDLIVLVAALLCGVGEFGFHRLPRAAGEPLVDG